MTNTPDTRTVNMVHHPAKDADQPIALDVFLDGVWVDGSATINVGTSDDAAGTIKAYGGGAGEAGGSLEIYNNADDDGTVDFWRVSAEDGTGDLIIQRDGSSTAFRLTTAGVVQVAEIGGLARFGADDTVPSIVELFGGPTYGGTLRIYQGASEDTGNAGEYFTVSCDGGEFLIRDASNVQALVINADKVPRFPQVTNGLASLDDNGTLTASLTSASDVSGSRAANTAYQNTTGRPLFVCLGVSSATGKDVQISSDNFSSSIITVGRITGTGNVIANSFWVPDDWYYRVNGSGTVNFWTEYN